MVLQSQLRGDVAGATKVREYMQLVRDLSRTDSPQELLETLIKRVGFVL